MRARSGLTGRGEVLKVIGTLLPSWRLLDLRCSGPVPRPSPATACHLDKMYRPWAALPSRASGFVHRSKADHHHDDQGVEHVL